MSKKVVVLGGGIIGLATAWHCIKRGHEVTLLDRRQKVRDGCSFGNAGMLVPSHFIPLAAPGMIKLGMKWLWSRESPFAIRPRLSWSLIDWLWKFQRACNQQHVEQNSPLLRDLNLAGRAAFLELETELAGEFNLVQKGLVMLCATEEGMHEEAEVAAVSNSLGVPASVMNPQELAELDPGIEMDVVGGVHFPLDCHLSPNLLMSSLEEKLQRRGVEFVWETECGGFRTQQNEIQCITSSTGEISGDEYVICGGAWSNQLADDLGISLPLQAGKGYSLTLETPRQQPTVCSILKEARVAVTPMGNSLRFGGTMEIVGHDESISPSRLRGIVRSIPEYFPALKQDDFQDCQPWVGLRPCSPDGLPYVGRTSKYRNLLMATGHGMMGISLSMITGKLIAEAIEDEPSSIDGIERILPDRFAN